MRPTSNYHGGITVTDDYWKEKVLSRMDKVEQEVLAVKGVVNHLETRNAVDEVHRNNVERRLSGIEGVLTKLTWLIVSGLVVALMAFIVGGGLSLV